MYSATPADWVYRLSTILQSEFSERIKWEYFRALAVSILLYGCTSYTVRKQLEKKLNGNYTMMLRTVMNKSGKQYPTKQQLYGYLLPISQTIRARRTYLHHHCEGSKDKTHKQRSLMESYTWTHQCNRLAKTYILQLDADTGWRLQDLPNPIADRGG